MLFARTATTLEEAKSLPRWRRPEALLYLMAAAQSRVYLRHTWSALIN